MNRFIEIAITKYVMEYPNANEREVMKHLQSLGYTNEEAGQLVLNLFLELRESSNT
jgi:hypothetical protein